MSDLISRQAMIDAMRRRKVVFCKNRIEFMALPKDEQARVDEIDNCISDLVNAPDAEPERKKGKWLVISEFEDSCYVKCNQCSATRVFYYNNKSLTNFCPNCGADMRGE